MSEFPALSTAHLTLYSVGIFPLQFPPFKQVFIHGNSGTLCLPLVVCTVHALLISSNFPFYPMETSYRLTLHFWSGPFPPPPPPPPPFRVLSGRQAWQSSQPTKCFHSVEGKVGAGVFSPQRMRFNPSWAQLT